MKTILFADDDLSVRKLYASFLESEGYRVVMAKDGEVALKKFETERPDLLLLDADMPKTNGFRVCEVVRGIDVQVPIIFLTGNAQEVNEVRAIGLGADDFVGKDEPANVLLMRIRRALERTAQMRGRAASGTLDLGRVSVDFKRLEVCENGRVRERLTKTESDILAALASDRGRVFSQEELMAAVYGQNYAGDGSVVYPHLYHLRQKLGPAAAMLESHRGAGYSLMR